MSSTRLQQQFVRLWQRFQGQDTDTTLEELAGVLLCSRRHIRSLLGAMQKEGWLLWQAEAGRGKRSRLSFIYTGLTLQQQRAEDLLEQDRVEQLIQLIGDKETVRQMLLSHLGRRFRQGKHLLRVLYYRPLRNLLPSSALRRSEMHIVRQIFCGLTKINEENGEIAPDLAHHWQQITPHRWRFYLRPAIRFHDGRELVMKDVIASVMRLTSQALFSHITRVTSPIPFVIDVELSEPDGWLPWLLGSAHAMILPHDWQTQADFARHPVGTGPYAVEKNSDSQLKIKAFDDYFGYRALIDEVNIWVLPDASEELPVSIQVQSNTSTRDELESRMEEGCYFLLFDTRSARGANSEVRRWISQIFHPITLLSQTTSTHRHSWSPAYSLLPRWHHQRFENKPLKPAGLTDITLTFYQEHPEYRIIGELMHDLLAQQGVTLHIQKVEYEQWYLGEAESDIWLSSVNCYPPLEFSLFALLYELPLLRHCLSDSLQQDAQRWHAQTLSIADFSQRLIDSGEIHPLFHHWLQLQGQRSMRGVRMNMLGWFDFKSAWFVPPEHDADFP
ncbi:HTH-type transcriptional regulator SgrR [Symbiopectobacterium sp. Eva_TO]